MSKRVLQDGDRRRLSDGRNAWRKMNEAQRAEFLEWIIDVNTTDEAPFPRGYILCARASRKRVKT